MLAVVLINNVLYSLLVTVQHNQKETDFDIPWSIINTTAFISWLQLFMGPLAKILVGLHLGCYTCGRQWKLLW